ERRVLRADLAVDRALERLPGQGGIAEGGQRIEVALLILRRGRRAEALEEVVVACGVARVRQHRDDGGQYVGIDGRGIGQVRPVYLGGARLHARVVAEDPERADQVAAQLARQLVLAGARRPAERGEGRRRAVAHERLEP